MAKRGPARLSPGERRGSISAFKGAKSSVPRGSGTINSQLFFKKNLVSKPGVGKAPRT